RSITDRAEPFSGAPPWARSRSRSDSDRPRTLLAPAWRNARRVSPWQVRCCCRPIQSMVFLSGASGRVPAAIIPTCSHEQGQLDFHGRSMPHARTPASLRVPEPGACLPGSGRVLLTATVLLLDNHQEALTKLEKDEPILVESLSKDPRSGGGCRAI